MVKRRLRKSQKSKSKANSRSGGPDSSSPPKQHQSPTSGVHQDPEEGYGEIYLLPLDDDYISTLSTEVSLSHYDGLSSCIGGKTQPYVQSSGITSRQIIQSKQNRRTKPTQKRLVDTRQTSLLDTVSSEATESQQRQEDSVAKTRQHSNVMKEQSSHIRRPLRKSRRPQISVKDTVTQQQQQDDEDLSWTRSIQSKTPVSIARTASNQSNTPEKLQGVPLKRFENHGKDYATEESRTRRKSHHLGPSWSGSLEQTTSKSSSTTSSVALIRRKWRASRREDRRKVIFHVDEDWCNEDVNVDWPGTAPRSRVLPTTILEEVEDDMPQQPTRKPWRVSSFFTCGCS